MARRPELAKYRWDPKLREWWDRMQQQPPKAREPVKPMEQTTIPDTDRPMTRALASNRRRPHHRRSIPFAPRTHQRKNPLNFLAGNTTPSEKETAQALLVSITLILADQ